MEPVKKPARALLLARLLRNSPFAWMFIDDPLASEFIHAWARHLLLCSCRRELRGDGLLTIVRAALAHARVHGCTRTSLPSTFAGS